MINSEQEIQSEQVVQKVCTQEPVVSTPLHGWLQSKVVKPVTRARAVIDEFERINGKLDQLTQVKSDLDEVKENCQNLKESFVEHDQELIATKRQLAEQQQIINDLRKQREGDLAKSMVEMAILNAKMQYCMDQLGCDLKDVKINALEKQNETNCALKDLQDQQKRTNENLICLENQFEVFESSRQREERKADRKSRAESTLDQSLELSIDDVQSRNEVLQIIRNKTPEPTAEQNEPIRFRIDSGVSITSNSSSQYIPSNTLTIPEDNST